MPQNNHSSARARSIRSSTISHWVVILLGYIFLFGPIVYVIIDSFNVSCLGGKWMGFSWRWYQSLWDNATLMGAFMTSLQIGVIVATASTILGTATAMAIKKNRLKITSTTLITLVTTPLVMPEVITGLALMLLFILVEQGLGMGSIRGQFSVICAHITVTTAYVFLMIQARLTELDKNLEEAAMDLGAKPWRVFCHITLPLIFPSVIGAWLLAFTISLDDVILASFVSGPGATTLPILIFSSIRLGITPEINAVATIMVGMVSLALLISGLSLYRKGKMEHKTSLPPQS